MDSSELFFSFWQAGERRVLLQRGGAAGHGAPRAPAHLAGAFGGSGNGEGAGAQGWRSRPFPFFGAERNGHGSKPMDHILG